MSAATLLNGCYEAASPSQLGRKRPVCTISILRRGLSCHAVDGRIPVDVNADHALDFSAEIRRLSGLDTANRVTSCRNPRGTFNYAFSPTGNSATLKGTPHPPIPQ